VAKNWNRGKFACGIEIWIIEEPEIFMSDELIEKSKKPIVKMLELSAKFNL
jgi:hypothetical protein